jgi:hypothetical protein
VRYNNRCWVHAIIGERSTRKNNLPSSIIANCCSTGFAANSHRYIVAWFTSACHDNF